MCMSVCVFMGVLVHVRPEVNIECLPQSVSSFFETESLTESGAH